MKLLSDQVSKSEIAIILRELEQVVNRRIEGDVVELGCYVGTTSVFLAEAIKSTNRQLYCYDSFEGLPEKSTADSSPAGTQFKKGELLTTKKQFVQNLKKANVPMPIVKKSWFADLTPQDLPSRIALAFLDGDYYQSIKDSLKLVWPRLTKGAIVIVDDYVSEALPGAAKAVNEWLEVHQSKLKIEQSLAIIHRTES